MATTARPALGEMGSTVPRSQRRRPPDDDCQMVAWMVEGASTVNGGLRARPPRRNRQGCVPLYSVPHQRCHDDHGNADDQRVARPTGDVGVLVEIGSAMPSRSATTMWMVRCY
uniref:Uncharacterized protein n=1 Tax=Oryza glumipatula TaxID=40148 RepID=A0A0E0B936_9ORYZ